MKAIIIARVSTEDQKVAGSSLPAQIFRMEKYCENKGFIIQATFSFDESAYKQKRVEFDKIVTLIKKSKDKIAVCFDKVDRLSRNIFDKRVAWLYEKATNNEIELHFVSDGQVINDNMNAGDKFAFGMKLGLSKYYSDAISDNVKRAFEQKRRIGEWTGRAPLGYQNIMLDKERRVRKDIILDEAKAALIKQLFELYSTGDYSLNRLTSTMYSLGLRSSNNEAISRTGIDLTLQDTFYYGIAESRKYGSYPHRYPTIISKELFDKCYKIRQERSWKKTRLVTFKFLFQNLLRCKICGCAISGERKTKQDRSYTYYSCTNAKGICKRIYIKEEILISEIEMLLKPLPHISEIWQKELAKNLKSRHLQTADREVTEKKKLESRLERAKELKLKLLDVYLENTIDKSTFEQRDNAYSDEIRNIENQITSFDKVDIEKIPLLNQVSIVATNAFEIFQLGNLEERRRLLKLLLQNSTVSGKKPEFIMRFPFNMTPQKPYLPPKLPREDTIGNKEWDSLREHLEEYNTTYKDKDGDAINLTPPYSNAT